MQIRHIFSFVAITSLFLMSFSAHSAVYKCKDVNGNITYSQTACPSHENIDKILSVNSGTGEFDVQCGIVKNFAAEIGLAVESGTDISELATEFGGEDVLSETAIKIMRSVYDYQSQPYKTTEDSVRREGEICKTEQYGAPECADFPLKFVKDYGGCTTVGESFKRYQRMSQERTGKKLQSDKEVMKQRLAKASAAAHQRDMDRREREQCLKRVDRQIKANAREAKLSNSAQSQDKLRRERRRLMESRGDC